MGITIGRLALSDPLQFQEPVGDPIGSTGSVAAPADRTPMQAQISLGTFAPDGTSDLAADRLRVRRQLRALLNNSPLKLAGLYLAWTADTEQNGWYVPDRAAIVDGADVTSIATGYFKISGGNWSLVGHPRATVRAIQAYMKDERLSTVPRDYLRLVYSTDFAAQASVNLVNTPCDITAPLNTVNGARPALTALPRTACGGGTESVIATVTDLTIISFEQPETSRNRGDVIIYDRRGSITAGTTATPDPLWEEVYGPDYPVSASDVPVVQNGQYRVRYDPTNTPGFAVDVWTGTAWTEQGKVNFQRAQANFVDTLVSQSVMEWTPERAVIQAVMAASADAASYERVFITLERGVSPRFEIYESPTTGGAAVTAQVLLTVHDADTNDSAIAVGSGGALNAQTAGSGSALFSNTLLGSFTAENWVSLLRHGATFHAALTVPLAATGFTVTNDTHAYGAARNTIYLSSPANGYMASQIGFYASRSDQGLEAEAMSAGTGTTSPVADAAASGGQTTTAVRTTDANPHETQASWGVSGTKYRVMVRVLTSAGTLSVYAKTASTTGATKTTTATSYTWVDLGDIVSNGGNLEIHAWTSSGTLKVDRVEAHKIEDRGPYDGARDLGQSALTDSRNIQTIVTR